MANGCSIVPSPIPAGHIDQPVFGNMGVAYRLQPRDARVFMAALEQMRKTALQFQIILHRNLAADLAHLRDLAVLGLEDRVETALDRQPRQPDRVVRSRPPAERARHIDLDVARAVDRHRLDYLALEI